MKALRFTLLLIICISLCKLSLHAQCEPDTANCKDDDEIAGQLCPQELADGITDNWYEEVITIIPPGEFVMGSTVILINYILIDSINNLPEGLTWEANTELFYADSAYCVLISGTPVEAGTDTLGIYITPFVFLGATTIPGPQTVDDTSIVMTVHETSGLDPSGIKEFKVLPNIPNPFSDITRIGVYTPFDSWVDLKVYDILGNLLHEEKQGFPPGEHYFIFEGQALQPGTYFYRISSPKAFFTGKIIKAGR